MKENKLSKWHLKSIATQILTADLQVLSGMSRAKTGNHFKKHPSQSDAQVRNSNSKVFYKYACGERSINNDFLIGEIEKEFPGVTKILDHPLWLILKNPSCSRKAITKNMQSLLPSIRSIVCIKEKKEGIYPRRESINTQSLYNISKNNDLDALACLLMIIREMEILKEWAIYTDAKWFAHDLLLRLTYFHPYKIVAEKIYKIIYALFLSKNILLPIENDFLFWRERHIAPSFIESLESIHQNFSELISNAKNYGLHAEDQHSKIKLLYCCSALGLNRLNDALNTNPTTPNSQIFINRLISAYNSHSYKSELMNPEILDIYGPFCKIDSTMSFQHHCRLLEYE